LPVKTCRSCGRTYSDSNSFCTGDGTRLTTANAAILPSSEQRPQKTRATRAAALLIGVAIAIFGGKWLWQWTFSRGFAEKGGRLVRDSRPDLPPAKPGFDPEKLAADPATKALVEDLKARFTRLRQSGVPDFSKTLAFVNPADSTMNSADTAPVVPVHVAGPPAAAIAALNAPSPEPPPSARIETPDSTAAAQPHRERKPSSGPAAPRSFRGLKVASVGHSPEVETPARRAKALLRENKKFRDVTAAESGDTLTLSGRVFDNEAKAEAERTARSAGVRRVVNALTTNTEQWAAQEARINQALRNAGLDKVRVRIIGTDAYLEGEVQNSSASTQAVAIVQGTAPVTIRTNLIRVVPGSLLGF
jgi:hypothetical protein